jgi:pheromone shutdown protein TraB
VPACVVGVVGLGHMPGIKKNWNKEINMDDILK